MNPNERKIALQVTQEELAKVKDDLEDNLGQQEELRSIERSLRANVTALENEVDQLEDLVNVDA